MDTGKEAAIVGWTLRLFFPLSRLMGLTPISFTKVTTTAGEWQIKMSALATIYSYLFNIFVFCTNTYTIHLHVNTKGAADISQRLERFVEYMAGATCLLTALFTSRMRISNLMSIFVSVSQVDLHFKRRFRRSDRNAFIIVAMLLMATYAFVVQDLFNRAAIGMEQLVYSLPNLVTLLSCITLEFEFVLVASCLQTRAGALLAHVQECCLTTETGAHAARALARLRTAHALQTRLRGCARALADAYGNALASLIVLLMFQNMVSIFHSIKDISTQRGDLVRMDAQWLCLTVSWILLLVEPCHRFVTADEEITYTACEAILELGASSALRGAPEQMRLRALWDRQFAYANAPLHFSAADLCRLNRELLASMAGVITTYVVILLQVS